MEVKRVSLRLWNIGESSRAFLSTDAALSRPDVTGATGIRLEMTACELKDILRSLVSSLHLHCL
jgi:hypothetical protein